MTTSVLSVSEAIKNKIRRQIQNRKDNPPQPSVHLHKIYNVRLKFSSYSEETTPKPALSSMYTCVGRHKFYPDKMLFMYLEVSNHSDSSLSLWPMRATWKVELIDEDDPNKSFRLGESSFIFNKPKQGFVSHPNDWISVKLDQLESSQLIASDGSATVKWSVTATPAIEYVYLEQWEELLLQSELNAELFDLSTLEKVQEISGLCRDNTTDISNLKESLKGITDRLTTTNGKVDHLTSHVNRNSKRISDLEEELRRLHTSVIPS